MIAACFSPWIVPLAAAMPAEPPHDIVVLVHGLWMTGMESGLLRSRLRMTTASTPASTATTPSRSGLEDNMRLLHEFLGGRAGRDRCTSSATASAGCSRCIRSTQFPDHRRGRVVCLGSPLRGSLAARAMAGLPFGEEILGATMRDAVLSGGMTEYRGDRARSA